MEEVTVLNIDGGSAAKTLKELRKEASGLKDELSNLDVNSKEYRKTLIELGKVQGEVTRINKDARAASQDFAQTISQVTNAAAGIAAGFGAVSSAAALFGVENSALAETLVKVQSGLALTQQLQGVAKGVQAANMAFKAFNATLYANPIMIVVAAVLALIAALVILGDMWASSKSGVDELKASYEEFQASMVDLQKEQDNEIKRLQAMGATEKELAEKRLEYARERAGLVEASKKEVDDEIAYLESKWKPWFSGQRKRLKELRRQQAEYTEQVETIYEEVETEITNVEVAEIKERTTARNKAADAARKAAEKLAQDILSAEKELTKNLAAVYGLREAERIAALKPEERLAEIEAEIAKQEEAAARYLAISEDETISTLERAEASKQLVDAETTLGQLRSEQDNLEAIRKATREEQAAQAEALRLATEALVLQEKEYEELRLRRDLNETQIMERDIEQAAMRQVLFEEEAARLQQELMQEELDNETRIRLLEELETARASAFAEEQTIWNKRKKLDEQEMARKKKDADDKKKIEQATLTASANFLSAASSLLGENTVAGKAMAVSGAVINTYLAATQALASYPPPASYVAMAATIVAGMATVKNILATKVEGASDSSSSAAASASLPTMPDMDSSFVETHNNFDAIDEDILNQQPVLPVESLNDVQGRMSVASQEASF